MDIIGETATKRKKGQLDMLDTYFSLHNHTDMSNALLGFSDAISKVPNLIQRAYDIGLTGVTITEHEGISSHLEALKYWQSMDKNRPFTLGLGNEIYLLKEEEDLVNRENSTYPYYHFILTALDTEGHKQLRELSTRAWKRAYKQFIWRRPTYFSDLEEIVKPNQGHLICSSACLGSRLDKYLLEYGVDRVVAKNGFLTWLVKVFGRENVYLEVQPAKDDKCDQSKVNRMIWEVHEITKLPIIATTDTHYLTKKESSIHKAFLDSQDGEREVDDFYATAYMMDTKDLHEHLSIDFSNEQIDQIFSNSVELGKRIKGYNLFHKPIIPQIPLNKIPDFQTKHIFKDWYEKYPYFGYYSSNDLPIHEKYFFYQVELGLKNKIVSKGKDVEKYIARLDEEWKELKVISESLNTSMVSYYSTMAEIINLIWEADSLSMPGRGSAAGFLTVYLLDITQIDPVPLGDYMPSWRHLNHQRGVELADIDNDSESIKKKAITQKIKKYFGEDKVLNVATFSKISARTAIEKACKGLDIPNDEAGYLKSLIPVNRGKVAKLKDCFEGKDKVGELIKEVAKYPNLKETILAFEGLIVNRGTHAAGLAICNKPYTEYVSAMRAQDGTLETCYDLWLSESASLVKVDMLSIAAATKIHRAMDYLIEAGKMEWQGSLKATYNKYLHPDVLEYNCQEMWDILPTIYSVFQMDTPVSIKALSATKPHSVMDLSATNSLLRLQPEGMSETPIDRYIRYKTNHEEWEKDTTNYGLNQEEKDCLWEYLKDAYGLADSQEKIMRLSMDKRVAGYTLKEANQLRKAIARKDEKLQAQSKAQFFEYGHKLGTRDIFLDYVWNVVFAASFGYSFSQVHSFSYSIIGLQELNLNWFYPRVYWNCACLSVEAMGNTEDDKSVSTDYGEIAKAIYKMKKSDISVSPPSIADSNLDFTPRERDNAILFGLAGIAGINSEISKQIISLRPYSSFQDFFIRNSFQGSLVTNSKFIQLIKAGCFDEFEPNRVKLMKQYICMSNPPKDKLTSANLSECVAIGAKPPKQLLSPYNFKSYVCSPRFLIGQHPKFKSKKLYWLDDKALKYFNANCSGLKEGTDWYVDDNGLTIVIDKSLDKLFKPVFDELKAYINTPEFLKEYNKSRWRSIYDKLLPNKNPNHWSLEAVSYYSREHELANVNFKDYSIVPFNSLPEGPVFITQNRGKREWKQYELHRICGTILARNDNNHLLTILTPENDVINVKFYAGLFAKLKAQISEEHDGVKTVLDKPWLARGVCLVITGYRRGESDFVAKKYRNSIFPSTVSKIEEINDDGSIVMRHKRYGQEEAE